MRALILSDIHSNVCALEAIERHERWDVLYCAGDLVDYGPFPREVIGWMRRHGARAVRGNHDAAVLGMTAAQCGQARRDGQLRWAHDNAGRLRPEDMAYLRSLPETLSFSLDGIAYQMQHQWRAGSYDTIEAPHQFEAFWQPQPPAGARRMIFGHTHRACVHQLGPLMLWLNPGSASYRRPDDPDKRAHYMIIEDGEIAFGSVAYDRTPLLDETRRRLAAGSWLDGELQVAFFFFGDAPRADAPLPG